VGVGAYRVWSAPGTTVSGKGNPGSAPCSRWSRAEDLAQAAPVGDSMGMTSLSLSRVRAAAGLILLTTTASFAQTTIDPSVWNGMRYRFIGPMRGGRVTAVTGVPSELKTFYMGSTGGGIWRTTDAGHTWVNLTDGQIPLGSMGAVDVAQSDPNVIYVGTGS